MPDKTYKNLEDELFEQNPGKLSFKDILPYTFVGAVGGALATSFQLLGYFRTPLREGIVRFISGTADALGESTYMILRELPKYFKKSENKGGPAVYYVSGKLVGALLAWLPDYILRNVGVDVHSSFPGSVVPAAYAQLDQIGAYFGMLAYHTRREGFRKGLKESLKDPVSQTSLIVSGASVGIDSLARIPLSPTNFWYDWVETWALSFLCLLPVWRGRKAEKKLKT